MNKFKIILTTMFLVTLYSCKTKLDSNDLTWLTFQEGDTLIFSSTENKFDTTFIVKRETIYPDYNPVEVHGKYHPQIGRIWYFNKNVPYINDGKEMVYLQKNSPDQKADGFISYLNSTFFFDTDYFNKTNDTVTFNGNQYTDIMKITDSYKINLTCDNLRTLWWSKKCGLLKYETCDGQIWTRIK
ncbi:MAG: hypothetical protein K9I37_07070 [Crocinitomicaceae bacterium]|nr:hypothetical protein [Crocinitomicaceae bacterium]